MKMDEDVKLCQNNAYLVLGRLTELFLQEIGENAHSVARLNKRKTMNLEDIGIHIFKISSSSLCC
jgi:histone H3/H4